MKHLVLMAGFLAVSLSLVAQDLTIIDTKLENGMYRSHVKFARDIDYASESIFEMKNANGDLFFGNIPFDPYDKLAKGSTKEVYFETSGPAIATSTKIMKLGTTPTLEAYDRFNASFSTAFLGDVGYYSSTYEPIKGAVKVGDKLVAKDEDGRTMQVTISAIELTPNQGNATKINSIDERFKMGDQFSLTFFFTTDSNRGPGGKFTLAAGSASSQATQTTEVAFKGEREVMKKDVVLTDGKIKITLNTLIKYNPKQADNPVFKIDETLDYYILDVTVENISKAEIDAGTYMIHLNLYDAAGINSDDHGRLFKNTDSEAKTEIDVVDKQILGGTSSIRYATVLVMYSEQDSGYSQQECDAAYNKLQPGQKVHCSSLKAIGVPKTYKPTEIGFWFDDIKKTVKAKL
ncbi:MAG: hypothetical protein QE487_11020 [Fluviicola sp.]|nr:hypothetical protein [Fluviicola sp.]